MIRNLLNEKRHPFWRHAKREIFLALRGDVVIGRIVVLIDDNYNNFHGCREGAWGFFECYDDQDAARRLFASAERWAKHNGLRRLRGPLNPSSNYEVGMLVDGFEFPQTLMMPYNPGYYEHLVRGAGYLKEKDLYSYFMDRSYRPPNGSNRLLDRIRKSSGVEFEFIEKSRIEDQIKQIWRVYHQCWSVNWGYTPMSDAEIVETSRVLLPLLEPELSYLVKRKGRAVGVCLTVPDINPMFRRLDGSFGLRGLWTFLRRRKYIHGLRMLLLGLAPEARHIGIPALMFARAVGNISADSRYRYVEMGWTLEDNNGVNDLLKKAGLLPSKRYRIYCKDLPRCSAEESL
jgi:hypothetical protein